MALEEYQKKRDFTATSEPKGGFAPQGGHSFVYQKHDATRLLPPAVETVRAHALKQAKGDRAFAELLLVARETGLEALDMACQLAEVQGHLNTSVVRNELRPSDQPAARQ